MGDRRSCPAFHGTVRILSDLSSARSEYLSDEVKIKKVAHSWLKPALTLIFLGILASVVPNAPIDPWNLLSPKKIMTMLLALATIQAFGAVMAQFLGVRTGAILVGFFGGLVSSTATTASLAKKSVDHPDAGSGEVLVFLSATGAMLFEGLALVLTGTSTIHLSNLIIFLGPFLTTLLMIAIELKAHKNQQEAPAKIPPFRILPLVKLTCFIVAILSVSKICQIFFGHEGLVVLTSLVSLFEVHGSVIANLQLHETEIISVHFLSGLLAISVIASYLSKLFLIRTMGSDRLRSRCLKRTFFLFCSLAISWLAAIYLF